MKVLERMFVRENQLKAGEKKREKDLFLFFSKPNDEKRSYHILGHDLEISADARDSVQNPVLVQVGEILGGNQSCHAGTTLQSLDCLLEQGLQLIHDPATLLKVGGGHGWGCVNRRSGHKGEDNGREADFHFESENIQMVGGRDEGVGPCQGQEGRGRELLWGYVGEVEDEEQRNGRGWSAFI